MLPQGNTPSGTVPVVTSVSSISTTVATPSCFLLKSDSRGLNVFKQEKQKVCFRELRDKETTSITDYVTVVTYNMWILNVSYNTGRSTSKNHKSLNPAHKLLFGKLSV